MIVALLLTAVSILAASAFADRRYLLAAAGAGLGVWLAMAVPMGELA